MIIQYFFIVALIYLLGRPYWIKANALRRWRRELNLNQHIPVFQELVKEVDGFSLSRIARMHNDAMEYTYGEVEFTSFIALIAMTQPDRTTRFYDLGSGTGKAVLACAMVFDMQYYCGIELFSELHLAARTHQHALQQHTLYKKQAAKVHFINDNFLHTDLRKATLIFINATALFGPTWERLNQKLTDEVTGKTIIISTSKPLKSASFIIISTTEISMSWGVVIAYIHSSVY